MPRYFFDIDNHKYVNDDDGTDLADDEEARVQAVIFAGDYLSVTVRNDQGSVLLAVAVMIDEPGDTPGGVSGSPHS